ncbi:MAG: formimidoylglutamate deiminase [Pseudomonadota bacterium]
MVQINARHVLTPTGWARDMCVQVEAGRIGHIGPRMGTSAHTVDLLLPAPVNLHSHAFQRAMAGLTEARGPDPTDSFWTWRRLMYQFLDQLTPDMVEAIAAQTYMEMLEAGYGAVAEFHYLHHDAGGAPYNHLPEMAARIMAAAEDTGLGLTLLPVLYMQGGCDGRPLAGGQRRFGCDLDLFARLYEGCADLVAAGPDDAALGLAPHSLRAVPPGALAEMRALCPSGPLHMHLAEQVAEVTEVQAHLGARPVTWLLDNAPVDPAWCLIHCTQMTNSETAALAAAGAVAGLCPITESSLGDGIFDGVAYHGAQGRFGIGSDSNIHIALWEELATLDYSQRLRDRSRAALALPDRSTGRALFDAAARAGAQAAARASGRIEVGAQADLIALSTDNEVLAGRSGDTLLDSLIFSGRGHRCVTDVWSAGRHMVQNSQHIHRGRIATRYKDVLHTLGQAL